MEPRLYTCGIPNEFVERYKPGCYYPVQLGDTFSDNRYRILHKLGWGSYSTTWLARDDLKNRNVALKVSSADATTKTRPGEKELLQAISALPKSHPGHVHIVSLLDSFMVHGLNGAHSCLVLELLGPSVHETNLYTMTNYAFPASVAKKLVFQVLSGIDFLSSHGIGHRDLHTNNLVFEIPGLNRLPERELLKLYSKQEMVPVKRTDGGLLGVEVPPCLVEPATVSYRLVMEILSTDTRVKIIDFGEAFFDNDRPEKLSTAFTCRAPEVFFGVSLDRRVDLWPMGCMLFNLAAAHPPFDSINDIDIIEEMLSMPIVDKQLPPWMQAKWRARLSSAGREEAGDTCTGDLNEWLERAYSFRKPEVPDGADSAEDVFSKKDLAEICRLMGKLMRFEPRDRAEVAEILEDPWFRDSAL